MIARNLSCLTLILAVALPAAGEPTPATSEPAPPELAVRAILGEATQALLYDEREGQYILIRVGSVFDGHHVAAIQPSQVVLAEPGGVRFFVYPLIEEESGKRSRRNQRPPRVTVTTVPPPSVGPGPEDPYNLTSIKAPPAAVISAPVKAPAPADPYADATPLPAPADPYADATPLPAPADPYAATAPKIDPYAGIPPLSIEAPAPAAPSGPTPVDPYAGIAVVTAPRPPLPPATPPAPVDAAESAPTTADTTLSRQELEQNLSDFTALSKQVQIEGRSRGGFTITGIAAGSYFHRLGFRRGDVILSVAGIRLQSVDDAARIYAALLSDQSFEVDLRRGGKARTLKFLFSQ